jgi:hypothetical protein
MWWEKTRLLGLWALGIASSWFGMLTPDLFKDVQLCLQIAVGIMSLLISFETWKKIRRTPKPENKDPEI